MTAFVGLIMGSSDWETMNFAVGPLERMGFTMTLKWFRHTG